MESQRRRSTRSKSGRRRVFGSPDDYDRHMQSSIAVDDGQDYEDTPPELYAYSSHAVEDVEPPSTD